MWVNQGNQVNSVDADVMEDEGRVCVDAGGRGGRRVAPRCALLNSPRVHSGEQRPLPLNTRVSKY